MRPSRERDRDRLARELEKVEHQEMLQALHRGNPFLRQFRGWGDVISFMRNGISTDPRKDEILRPIFESHSGDGDPRWREILLVIFWPGLESLHFQKRHWDSDPEELWHNIVWTFLEVICRIDVAQRPERLAQKVVNDTAHHLHDEYRRLWKRCKQEESVEAAELLSIAARPEEGPYAVCLQREAQEIEIRRLREHREAGRITDAGFLLIVGSRIYGMPFVDCAREIGLTYQAAKKRRQRAEAAIRRFQEHVW